MGRGSSRSFRTPRFQYEKMTHHAVIARFKGRFNQTQGIWRDLPGGRQIEFGGCKDPGDEQAYQSVRGGCRRVDFAHQTVAA